MDVKPSRKTDYTVNEKTPDNTAIPVRILVFQQGGKGDSKVKGIEKYGRAPYLITKITIEEGLPPVIDDTSEYFPESLDADIVLDYLKHPDLSHDLAALCKKADIPMIASGKKTVVEGTLTPPICCALARHDHLGSYGDQFGYPEFDVSVEKGKIKDIRVIRGAPCGATWDAVQKIVGMAVDEAPVRFGLDTQFFCTADPANWDPIGGKSPVHLAADIHRAALIKALKLINGDR